MCQRGFERVNLVFLRKIKNVSVLSIHRKKHRYDPMLQCGNNELAGEHWRDVREMTLKMRKSTLSLDRTMRSARESSKGASASLALCFEDEDKTLMNE